MLDVPGGFDREVDLDFSAEFTLAELRLIAELKGGDYQQSAELRAAFVNWVNENLNELNKDNNSVRTLAFMLKKARLLIMAGLKQEALSNLRDLRGVATMLGRKDLVEECNRLAMALLG